MPRESVLVGQILRAARARGCFAVKTHGNVYTQRGMPDVTIYVPVSYQPWAIPLLVEAKQPGEVPGTFQQHMLTELRRYGVATMVATHVQQVVDAITRLKHEEYTQCPL